MSGRFREEPPAGDAAAGWSGAQAGCSGGRNRLESPKAAILKAIADHQAGGEILRSFRLVARMLYLGSVLFVATESLSSSPVTDDRTSVIDSSAARTTPRTARPMWVFFTEKRLGEQAESQRRLGAFVESLPERTRIRRSLRRTAPGLADVRDLPPESEYVAAVRARVAAVRHESRWLNAVSVLADDEQIRQVSAMPFVRAVQPVARAFRRKPLDSRPVIDMAEPQRGANGPAYYGFAYNQLNQLNIVAAHNAGYTGSGVVIGILDTGFNRTHVAFNQTTGGAHPVQILAEYDFINNDADTSQQPADPPDQAFHGTAILGTLAAFQPTQYVGSAIDASFLLAKTEDISQEVPLEEDHYVAGLEWIELNGADLATSSLGYIDWYTQANLDGQTAVTTIAVNIATQNGLVCCTAAGNMGHDNNPATSHLIAPADALQVLTCGATDGTGAVANFSSDGPTFDGRPKPELLARGLFTVSTYIYDNVNYYGFSGTSLSTPLVAGGVALIIQARPTWSVEKIRRAVLHTATDFRTTATYDPLHVRGYGLLDVMAAIQFVHSDVNGDGFADLGDVAPLVSALLGENADPNERRRADIDANGRLDGADVAIFLDDILGS